MTCRHVIDACVDADLADRLAAVESGVVESGANG